jgi:hypothetical protein
VLIIASTSSFTRFGSSAGPRTCALRPQISTPREIISRPKNFARNSKTLPSLYNGLISRDECLKQLGYHPSGIALRAYEALLRMEIYVGNLTAHHDIPHRVVE